ncbi:sortase domain-containing protein [Pasteuria penetrans]|uniref:sortase domain-containing protein n=1 Tax=Pasteuria penetrans TaxID=86005 RepID=UPI000F923839|nr:sortase [Pasteuria penetrans]
MARFVERLIWLIILGSLGVCGYLGYQWWSHIRDAGVDDPAYILHSMKNPEDTSPKPTILPKEPVHKIGENSEKCSKVMELIFPNRSDKIFNVRLTQTAAREDSCLKKGPIMVTRSSTLKYPGEPGLSFIAAHRDTSFIFLKEKDLRIGDYAILVDKKGTKRIYQIRRIRTIPKEKATLKPIESKYSILWISTCFPFSFHGPAPYRRIFELDLVREEKGIKWHNE